MAADAVTLITALSKETVVYTPHGGVSKTIPAIIDRPTLQVEPAGSRGGPVNTLSITIANDTTDGVTAVKERFDTVAFTRTLDDAASTTFVVTKILQQDNGMVASDGGCWTLEVKA